ncbi:MAG: hypothetical protein F2737_10440 [Actinobacteria bacterium]|nr:hypothetical protein [Actinomycetota bacterium]
MNLRVMTWNVLGSARPDRDGLARAIQSFAPDVVAIQEIRLGQANRLANRLGWRVVWTFKHFPLGPLVPWRAEGIAVISRHAMALESAWELSSGVGRSTYHRRVAQAVRVNLSHSAGHTPEQFCVVNTHLESNGANLAERVRQAQHVVGHVTERGIDVSVLVGDLNASEEPDVLAPFAGYGLLDAWTSIQPGTAGSGCTVPSAHPDKRLDYVLVGPRYRVVGVQVPDPSAAWAALSDHLPVVVDLEVV